MIAYVTIGRESAAVDRPGPRPPTLRLLLRGRLRLLLLAQALGADHPDRRLRLALGADRAQAPLAEHEALPVRMPVAEVLAVALEGVGGHGQACLLDRDDVDRLEDDRLDGTVTRCGGHLGDRVDDGLRRVVGDLAEDRVLALQPLRAAAALAGDRDEELRAVGALDLAGDARCGEDRRWPWRACTGR